MHCTSADDDNWIRRTHKKMVNKIDRCYPGQVPRYQAINNENDATVYVNKEDIQACESTCCYQLYDLDNDTDYSPEKLNKARRVGIIGMIEAISNLYTETPCGYIVREISVLKETLFSCFMFLNMVIQYLIQDGRMTDKNFFLPNVIINSIILIFSLIDISCNCPR